MPEESNHTISDFYISLEDALEEISCRMKNEHLTDFENREISIPHDFISSISSETSVIIFRQLATPTHEILRIIHAAKSLGLKVKIIEYLDDKFTPSVNEYKYNLGKLPVYNGSLSNIEKQIIHKISIVDFAKMEGRPIRDIETIRGENLVDLHHELFEEICKTQIELITVDASVWLKQYGGAREYYKDFFKLFVVRNILAEVYLQSGNERAFSNTIILPILKEIHNQYEHKPLIWNYLGDTDDEMKYYWECYPKQTADFLKKKGYY